MDKIQPTEVCKVAGISYRQFQYWDARQYVKTKRTDGNNRLIRFRDLLLYVAIANLKNIPGQSIQGIARDHLHWITRKVMGSSNGGSSVHVAEFGPGCKMVITKSEELFMFSGHFATTAITTCFLDYDEVRHKLEELRSEPEDTGSLIIGNTHPNGPGPEFGAQEDAESLNSTDD